MWLLSAGYELLVPNVPCGVESLQTKASRSLRALFWFLMYRVELKDIKEFREPMVGGGVPNVPCGVESPDSSAKAMKLSGIGS